MDVLAAKILIVVTSHASLGTTGKPTGYYLSEVTHPHAALLSAGLTVDIASPKGGAAPLDPKSLDLNDEKNEKFWHNPDLRSKLEHTLALADINPDAYQAIIFAGGHGTMWDFPDDLHVQRLAGAIYDRGGVVAAVCHGPAALVNVKLNNGSYLVDGKNVAAFSNSEEEAAGLTKVMPFLLESKLLERGANYSKNSLWQKHVVVDQRLVTGQNPASASGVGEAVVKLLLNK